MTVLFLGPLPPPVHGFSAINQAMLEKLQEHTHVEVFDRSPVMAAGARAPLRRQLGHWLQLVQRFHKILRTQSPISLYAGFSGGRGQLLDLPFFVLARLYRLPVHLHHHSFAYLNEHSLLTAMTLKVAEGAKHIVLCEEMGTKLGQHYGIARKDVDVVSNAAFLPTLAANQPNHADKCVEADRGIACNRLRIGFLSNITAEKGIFEFFDVIDAALAAGLPIQATIAGPVDPQIATEFQVRLDSQKSITHIGAVYGEEKLQFYRGIDVLLFPTKYKNEAEPVTILEAQQCGVTVIAASRGCISGMVGESCGVVVSIEEYKSKAVSELRRRCAELPTGLQVRRDAISARAVEARQMSLLALQGRLKTIAGANRP